MATNKGTGLIKKTGRLRHGESRQRPLHPVLLPPMTAEYRCWAGMKQRCCNPNQPAFRHYGGRGISICERWLNSYENFLADMGRKPSPKHSIDRIDNDGPYSPENCRWATRREQARNKRPPGPVVFSGGKRVSWGSRAGKPRHVVLVALPEGGWKLGRA